MTEGLRNRFLESGWKPHSYVGVTKKLRGDAIAWFRFPRTESQARVGLHVPAVERLVADLTGSRLIGKWPPTIEWTVELEGVTEAGIVDSLERELPELQRLSQQAVLLPRLQLWQSELAPNDKYPTMRLVALLLLNDRANEAQEVLEAARSRYLRTGIGTGLISDWFYAAASKRLAS